jgi:hypothetical protein
MDFCKNGYMVLEGVVPDEVNRKVIDFLDVHTSGEPVAILDEEWFVDAVIKNPEAAGAARSLLGKDVKLPGIISNHRVHLPQPAQTWHPDAGSIMTPRLDYLQVFYYPDGATREMGPTEVIPGSHLRRGNDAYLGRVRSVKSSVLTIAPPGSIFLTVYSIWHRRSASTGSGIRNNLKYNYWRTAEPKRDWAAEPDFNFSWLNIADSPRFGVPAAEMFSWLCGEEWQHLGGQSWPCFTISTLESDQEGLPQGLRRHREQVRG